MRYLFAAVLIIAVSTASAQKAKTVEVYLIGGQSNATGQGYLANMADSMKVDTRVMLYHSGKPHLDSGLPPFSILPLHQASESPDRFGPELGFGTRIQALRPKATIAIIKHAHSGTNLYSQWNPGANEQDTLHQGEQFKVFIKTVASGMDSLRRRGYKPVIKGMVWQQGESDADKEDTISRQYGKNLAHLIARLRQQLQVPKMLFIYGYVYPPPAKGQGITDIRQAQHDVDQNAKTPLSVKRAFVVYTDDLDHRATDRNTRYPNDHTHFGTDGTWILGLRMAERMSKEL